MYVSNWNCNLSFSFLILLLHFFLVFAPIYQYRTCAIWNMYICMIHYFSQKIYVHIFHFIKKNLYDMIIYFMIWIKYLCIFNNILLAPQIIEPSRGLQTPCFAAPSRQMCRAQWPRTVGIRDERTENTQDETLRGVMGPMSPMKKGPKRFFMAKKRDYTIQLYGGLL